MRSNVVYRTLEQWTAQQMEPTPNERESDSPDQRYEQYQRVEAENNYWDRRKNERHIRRSMIQLKERY